MMHDGLIFGSGWYEDGPSRANLSGFTKAFVQSGNQSLRGYRTGRDRSTTSTPPESADGQWYVFIADEDGILIAHPTIPENVGQSLLGEVGIDPETDHPYGLDILGTYGEGQWFRYNFHNPHTGEIERQNTWVVRHDGLFFGSGWYGIPPDIIGLPATGDRTIPTGWLIAIGLGGFFALAAGRGHAGRPAPAQPRRSPIARPGHVIPHTVKKARRA